MVFFGIKQVLPPVHKKKSTSRSNLSIDAAEMVQRYYDELFDSVAHICKIDSPALEQKAFLDKYVDLLGEKVSEYIQQYLK